MKKIIVSLPDANDGCNFYRGAYPWGHLARIYGSEFDIDFIPAPSHAQIRSADLLFLLRPCTEASLSFAQTARDFGTRVWVDYDDDLFAIRNDNPSFAYFQNPIVLGWMEKTIGLSDILSISTMALNESLAPKAPNAQIILLPNAYDPVIERWRTVLKRKSPDRTSILWRGTTTHGRDLLCFADPIRQAMKTGQDSTQWLFLGGAPWPLGKIPENCAAFPATGLPTYFRTLSALSPDIVIVPLEDCHFNRVKSNIAAIEGAWAGAAILAPDWPEWDLPGVTRYGRPGNNFTEALSQMIAEKKSLPKLAQMTFDYAKTALSLSLANQRRLEVLRGVL